MRSIFFISLFVSSLFWSACVGTRPVINLGSHKSLPQEIERIIKETDPNVNVGIRITDLALGQTIYEKDAQRLFIPGSTNKLVVLAAALHYLGPSYRFRTGIYTDGFKDERASVLNLYLKGSGDPSLMDSDLAALATELKQMGIKKVMGNILVDDSIFDSVLWGKGTMWEDHSRGYGAPVTGLNLNYNRILIKTTPAHQAKSHAFSTIRPDSSFVYLSPKAITKPGGTEKNLSIAVERDAVVEEDWPLAANDGLVQNDKIIVNGHVPLGASPAYSLLAVRDPSILAGTYFKEQLEHLGIKVSGEVLRAKTPTDARPLTEHESRSLSEALIDFTKISNNMPTDAVIKAMAANAGVIPASFDAGLKLINEFLVNQVRLKPGSMVTADGAGLSRYNLITPEQLDQILVYAATKFHMGPEFIAALPIAGKDGTLGARLKAEHIRGNVRAKTGSMSGVSSLAGYLNGDDGRRYSFVIMINGFVGPTYKYTQMQDAIVASLFQEPKDKALAKVK